MAITNYFQNMTDIGEMLKIPNTVTGGWFWLGMEIMIFIVLVIIFLGFGVLMLFYFSFCSFDYMNDYAPQNTNSHKYSEGDRTKNY
ncbi:unnamed protein product [marine sediment metagenome]|uniref:Uncharacterized protein n=1 Tax=marine sediment metagenome TaxID=412755 RepID=X1B450_9ZZZZ